MYQIVGKRGSGKTTKCFERARKQNAIVLCTNKRAMRVKADELGYQDVEIVELADMKDTARDQKVVVDEDRVSDHFYSLYDEDSEDEEDVSEWYENNFDEIDATMQAFVDYYGGAEADILQNFLNKVDINAIHSGNVGYDEDDNLIIIDYAGYSSEDYWDKEHEAKIQNILVELEKKAEKPVL